MSASYAFGGSPGSACTDDPVTGEHHHHYASPGVVGMEFARPRPAHALTAGAEAARETMRRVGREKRVERTVSSLVTQHGNPHVEPYDGPLVPAAAKVTERKARAAGFETTMHETPVGCSLHGVHRERGVGFAAHWLRGKTAGGTWHERETRYKLVDISDRPIGVDQKTRLTKAKHRHDESDRTRLVCVASPHGVSCGITEIERRIAS